MGAAQGVEARLRAGGVGGGDARAALGAHGGVWRGRRAQAAQGALQWLIASVQFTRDCSRNSSERRLIRRYDFCIRRLNTDITG